MNLVFGGCIIRVEVEFLNLTDMWKAAGTDPSKRPGNWAQLPHVKDFAEFVAGNLTAGLSCSSLFRTTEGRGGATWAHWQVGLAYAKYLSPAFHAWANQVVRDYMSGKLRQHVIERSKFELLLLDKKSKWERLWEDDLRLQMKRLCRAEYSGDSWPLAGMPIISKIYDLVIGEDVMAEVRQRAKTDGGNDVVRLHQYLTPDARKVFADELGKVLGIAISSKTTKELLGSLEAHYAKAPTLGTGQSGNMRQIELGPRYCHWPNCGLPNSSEMKFCGHCGRRLRK